VRNLIAPAFLGALALAPAAAAQETPAQAAPAQTEEFTNEQLSVSVRRWYGWQTLAVDAAALATALTGYAANDWSGNIPGTIGILGYLFGPPIVHWVHGHAGRGAADLGLRFLGPFALGGLGYLLGLPGGTNANGDAVTAQTTGAIGLALGYATVVTVDAAVFGFETRLESPESPPNSPSSLLVPDVQLRRGGGTLGVRGAF
jgi:hypothetical protein